MSGAQTKPSSNPMPEDVTPGRFGLNPKHFLKAKKKETEKKKTENKPWLCLVVPLSKRQHPFAYIDQDQRPRPPVCQHRYNRKLH